MKRALVITGVLALGTGIVLLGRHLYRQAKLLMDFCFQVDGYNLIELNRKRIAFSVDLKVRNKSKINVDIISYSFNIKVNGKFISQVKSTGMIAETLPAEGIGGITATIDIRPDQAIKNLANWDFISGILIDQKNVKISFEGGLSANVAGIKIINIPISVNTTVGEIMEGSGQPAPPCM